MLTVCLVGLLCSYYITSQDLKSFPRRCSIDKPYLKTVLILEYSYFPD